MNSRHTYWATVYNPAAGSVYTVPIVAEDYTAASAQAAAQYGNNLRWVSLYE
jgi:hypothetical protein